MIILQWPALTAEDALETLYSKQWHQPFSTSIFNIIKMEASSSSTELALFKLKMLIASYVTEIICLHVSYSNLKRLNEVKAVFHRLGHSNIYIYLHQNILFAGWSTVFYSGFMNSSVFQTQASKMFLKERWAKKRDKELKFLLTLAMNGK